VAHMFCTAAARRRWLSARKDRFIATTREASSEGSSTGRGGKGLARGAAVAAAAWGTPAAGAREATREEPDEEEEEAAVRVGGDRDDAET